MTAEGHPLTLPPAARTGKAGRRLVGTGPRCGRPGLLRSPGERQRAGALPAAAPRVLHARGRRPSGGPAPPHPGAAALGAGHPRRDQRRVRDPARTGAGPQAVRVRAGGPRQRPAADRERTRPPAPPGQGGRGRVHVHGRHPARPHGAPHRAGPALPPRPHARGAAQPAERRTGPHHRLGAAGAAARAAGRGPAEPRPLRVHRRAGTGRVPRLGPRRR